LTNSYIYDDLSEVFFLFFIDDLCWLNHTVKIKPLLEDKKY
jgi:hypothetical protein